MKGKKAETTTTKITTTALTNFRHAAAISGEKQYEIIEEASFDVLRKISARIQSTRNEAKNHLKND